MYINWLINTMFTPRFALSPSNWEPWCVLMDRVGIISHWDNCHHNGGERRFPCSLCHHYPVTLKYGLHWITYWDVVNKTIISGHCHQKGWVGGRVVIRKERKRKGRCMSNMVFWGTYLSRIIESCWDICK